MIPDDITAPTVTGATSTTADGFYKAGAAVNITVNFSEPVTSAGLTINLNSGATITTGALTSQSSWSGTYTVAAGQTSGDLTISAITGTITDAAANSSTNPAIPTGQNIADTRAIVIDTTAPTAVSAGANQTKNAPFTQTGTASDTNPMTYQWAMQSGPGAITCGTPTASSTTISATVGGTYIIRFTATDAAGNSTSSDMTLIWDASAPTVTGATSTTADGFYKAGGAVNVTVTFSEAVTSAGLTITLNSGAVITTGALNSQSIWSGTYTVAAGQTSGDLTISSITGTITNAAANSTTNPAIPAGQNIADTKAIVIDTTAPVTTATPAGGSFGSAQNVILSANEQATIYYTTNGSDPTASSSVYGTAIPIAATATLKFFAKDQTGNVEAIKSQTYTIYLNGIPGDLDGDGAVTLADAIIALQAMVGMQVPKSGADINGDGKVGLPELLYILQQAAGVRQ